MPRRHINKEGEKKRASNVSNFKNPSKKLFKLNTFNTNDDNVNVGSKRPKHMNTGMVTNVLEQQSKAAAHNGKSLEGNRKVAPQRRCIPNRGSDRAVKKLYNSDSSDEDTTVDSDKLNVDEQSQKQDEDDSTDLQQDIEDT